MSMRALELRRRRAKAVADARAIIDVAETRADGQKTLTQDEERQFQAFMAEADKLLKDVETEERLSSMERELGGGNGRPGGGTPGGGAGDDVASRAYRKYLTVGGRQLLSADESRALQADSDIAGGYLVMPRQQSQQLIQVVDDLVFIRKLATIEKVTAAQGLGIASLDADPADPDWSTEIKAVNFDSSMQLGDRELRPNPLTKGIKVSMKLMRLAKDPEGLVRKRMGYKFAIAMEKGYLTGNGAKQPLGLFVASNQGISTARDVATGNTATAITMDGLYEAKYSLKQQYWAKAQWLFHRDGVKQVAKLKDGNGRYLWQDSVQVGQPDRLLNLPVNMSEYVPNTFTTGQYVGMVGDFSFYQIVDAEDVMIQRLDELYAETRQTGFIGEAYSDGAPVLEEAFSRVTLG